MRTIADLMSMKGRVAAITGGCGHIGRAMAEALAEQGCALLLIDRNADALVATAGMLKQRWKVGVETLAIDLESEEQRSTVRQVVSERFGRLDVLVNNAGFVGDSQLEGWVAPFEQQSMATWRRAIEVNVTAAFHLCQELAGLLRASERGAIVNVASIYGVLGPDMRLYAGTSMGNPAAYAASKSGLIQLTRWLSTVVAPEIRVNCISPGGLQRNQPDEFQHQYASRTPLARMGREEDIKGATVYLASDLSAWVTGQNVLVDGGWSSW